MLRTAQQRVENEMLRSFERAVAGRRPASLKARRRRGGAGAAPPQGHTASNKVHPCGPQKKCNTEHNMMRVALAGREGKLLQSRVIRDRLFKELDRNVALKVRRPLSRALSHPYLAPYLAPI